MDNKGMYDIKHAYEVAEQAKNGDEKRAENGKKMADICVKGKVSKAFIPHRINMQIVFWNQEFVF